MDTSFTPKLSPVLLLSLHHQAGPCFRIYWSCDSDYKIEKIHQDIFERANLLTVLYSTSTSWCLPLTPHTLPPPKKRDNGHLFNNA